MRVEIPMLPPRELNPNYHGHWARKAKAARSFRDAAHICVIASLGYNRPRLEKAEVSVTFVIPNRHHIKDADNALASLKPAIDGSVDAGIILGDDDAHLRYKLPILYQVDKEKAPMTILEFKELVNESTGL